MKKVLLVVFLLSWAWARPPFSVRGQVVRVVDGDTVRVRLSTGERALRLDSIDAPEHDQPGGAEARAALARSLPPGAQVKIWCVGQDRYGRMVGQLYRPDGANVNVLQVRNGNAWVYERYCRDVQYWDALQRRARSERLGLWGQESPKAPWEFRESRHRRRP